MTLHATGTVSAPRENTAQFYIPAPLARDSRFPFDAGAGFRAHIVSTATGRDVLVLCRSETRVAVDETSLVLERAVDRGANPEAEADADRESSLDHAHPGENGATATSDTTTNDNNR